ncbi:F0F1 ATP synthase subunit A [Mycoplasma zalophidermidis]|uniref:F0F1 ATP synthase subunit A n=1 Tax=Mycoplasma zalophidermidis TaxID=398174 RepID=A0ABS6DTK1_9MOLU|nr:F0F1 ATP synthase subunit A [Mycoplasma zalophidermidis]MBU4689805.1 F0F1 ATP synthase subunit A [Mycoplasma zalophidermidis]MBU4693950.1 F0F1 ATP synthase subunit A [Mycoplasma zalophidermidis]MCR8966570.1 F0F1 ATP synthase subunit A [Mycoplasma zalophidermidis]
MQKIIEAFSMWNQPQLFSLAVTVLIIFIVSLVVFIKIKKHSKPNKAPVATVLIAENYVTTIDNAYDDTASGKLPIARFYIFGLATFLLVGNMLGLIGLEPIATSYSITFTLAAVTFIGIYLVGFWYQKLRFFLRYIKNPAEILGQFSPLISLGCRMFGNITGGAVIVTAVYFAAGWLWGLIFPGPQLYFFACIVTPWMHMFFDIFGAVIQALIFTVLTTIYWTNEVEIHTRKNKTSKKQLKNQQNIINISKNIY